MKTAITNFIFISALFISSILCAQSLQKNFINYQGVAKNASGDVLSDEAINIQIALKRNYDRKENCCFVTY